MAFEYNEAEGTARNPISGESLSKTHAYTDIGGVLVYLYECPGKASIEAYVSFKHGPRSDGPGRITLAAILFEKQLRQAYSDAYPGSAEADWLAFRKCVEEALFAIVSRGGRALAQSPDLHVEWEQEVPER